MKFAAIISAAAFVAASSAAPCDVTALTPLLTKSYTTKCSSESGYTVAAGTNITDAQKAIMCQSEDCGELLAQLKLVVPTECSVGSFNLYADVLTPLETYCTSGSSISGSTVGSTDDSSTSITAPTNSSSASSSSADASASASGSSGASSLALSAASILVVAISTFF